MTGFERFGVNFVAAVVLILYCFCFYALKDSDKVDLTPKPQNEQIKNESVKLYTVKSGNYESRNNGMSRKLKLATLNDLKVYKIHQSTQNSITT